MDLILGNSMHCIFLAIPYKWVTPDIHICQSSLNCSLMHKTFVTTWTCSKTFELSERIMFRTVLVFLWKFTSMLLYIVFNLDLSKPKKKGTLHLSFLWRCGPTRAMASSCLRILDHTQRNITVGRTSLDEWSARRRDLCLKTHITQHRQPCSARHFETTVPASERP